MIAGDYGRTNSDIGNTRQPLIGTRSVTGLGPIGSIYDTNGEITTFGHKEQYGVSAKLTHNFGWANFTSTSAYRHIDVDSLLDGDGGPITYLRFRTPELTKTFQQEFLLNGDLGRLDLTAGLFYFHSSAGWNGYVATSSVVPSNNFILFSDQRTNSYAGFAQGTYKVTDRTKFTVGLRYTRDTRDIEATQFAREGNARPVGTLLNSTDLLPDDQTHRTFNKLTWRFAVDQQVGDSSLLYASYSRGFKSGVFSTSSPFAPAVSPETLDAYELGAKTDLFDRTLRLNLSGYYYRYSDIQLQAINAAGATQLVNAALGHIKGAEGEITYAPRIAVGHLQFNVNLTYLDAKYVSFPNAIILTPRPTGGNVQTRGDLSGSDVLFSPRFTSSVTANYERPITSDYKIGGSITWYHNDGFFWDTQNRVRQPSYDIVNGQLTLSLPKDQVKVRLFGRNLLDKKYYSQVSPSPTGDIQQPAAPRTYGVAFDFAL